MVSTLPRIRRSVPNVGPREAAIMRVLWSSEDALSVRQVAERLDADIAYTTVMTLMSRLHDKGLLRRRRRGRGYAYHAVVTQSRYQARVMSAALARDVDVPEVLLHFVGDLTPKEQSTLRALLEDGP